MEAARWEAFIGFLSREGLLAGRDGAPLEPAHVPTSARIATNDHLPK